jgi:hypothetical protein
MSDEWLREGESSSEPIQISHASSLFRCRIRNQTVEALYNPVVGANCMSDNFMLAFLGSAALTPMGRTVRGPLGSLLGSYGVIQNVSLWLRMLRQVYIFMSSKFPTLIS